MFMLMIKENSMDCAKIIVDMYVSIDGKIDEKHSSMPGAAFSGNYYILQTELNMKIIFLM